MPVRAFPDLRMPRPDRRATIDFLPGSDVPVLRQPFDPSDALPFWANGRFKGDLLYDRSDPEVQHRPGDVAEMAELLRTALVEIEAPSRAAGRASASTKGTGHRTFPNRALIKRQRGPRPAAGGRRPRRAEAVGDRCGRDPADVGLDGEVAAVGEREQVEPGGLPSGPARLSSVCSDT